MPFINLVENRKSVREYQKKSLSSGEIGELKDFIKEVDVLIKNIAVDFAFIDDGWEKESILQGRAGYVGNPVLAPHYIALLSEEKEGYLLNTAYVLEQIVLKAIEMKIGSCWLSVENDAEALKRDLGIDGSGQIVAMIAVGHPKANLPFIKPSVSGRIGVEDFVFNEEWGRMATADELEMKGIERALHSIRLAPSWANLQPWRLIIDRDQIILTVGGEKVNRKHLMLDAGIMMLYMKKAFADVGMMADWSIYKDELDGKMSEYKIPANYAVIGTLHI